MVINNYSNILLLIVFAGIPLALVIYFHQKTFLKYWPIILKVNIFSFFIWALGGSVAYQQNIWLVTYHDFFNHKIFGILFGDIIQSIIGTTMLAFTTILIYHYHQMGKRIRDLIFTKE